MPSIKVVVLREGPLWVAQCLEYDICAQAESVSELTYEIQRVLAGHVAICVENSIEPFSDCGPAPKEFWTKWEGATVSLKYDMPDMKMPANFIAKQPTPEIRLAA